MVTRVRHKEFAPLSPDERARLDAAIALVEKVFAPSDHDVFLCEIPGRACGLPVGETGVCANGHDWTPAGVFRGARIIGVDTSPRRG